MFYEQLIKACDINGIKLTPLLKELGVSTGNTSSWKRGSHPRADVLNALADRLNVSVDYLLGNTDDPGPASEDEKKASPDEIEAELRRIIMRIPDKEFAPEKVNRLVETLKSVIDMAMEE